MSTHVLLVDDEDVSRRYVAQMAFWQQGEFRLCLAAKSGAEALERLAVGDIDILLMDVYMPGMDGVTLSSAVAAQYPGVAMVAISNFDHYDYVRQIMKNGAEDYLLKARLDESSLLSVLRRTRDRTRQEPKHLFRERVTRWLDGVDADPFPNDGARLGAVVYTLSEQGALPEGQQAVVVEGVLRLLEGTSTQEEDHVAVFRPPAHFVLFVRYYATASMAEIRARMQALSREAAYPVERIYHFSLQGDLCMPMLDNRMLLSYIVHRLERPAQPEEGARRITLSITQHKQLFHVMEDRNIPATTALLREILEEALAHEPDAYAIILREVVEVLSRAAEEYGAPLPEALRGANLYPWMRDNPPPAQIEELISAARQMLQKALLVENTQYSSLVRNAMIHMREGYAHPIGLKELAEALGCNPSYLSRTFHLETGMTVIEYLTQVRIGEAKRLITRNIPLKQVAVQVGFPQYTYFLKVFKQETGMTPKQFLALKETHRPPQDVKI